MFFLALRQTFMQTGGQPRVEYIMYPLAPHDFRQIHLRSHFVLHEEFEIAFLV